MYIHVYIISKVYFVYYIYIIVCIFSDCVCFDVNYNEMNGARAGYLILGKW